MAGTKYCWGSPARLRRSDWVSQSTKRNGASDFSAAGKDRARSLRRCDRCCALARMNELRTRRKSRKRRGIGPPGKSVYPEAVLNNQQQFRSDCSLFRWTDDHGNGHLAFSRCHPVAEPSPVTQGELGTRIRHVGNARKFLNISAKISPPFRVLKPFNCVPQHDSWHCAAMLPEERF